ncbi:unnamed protein product [Ceratitis capitata]|uniref:(Mediterranean fruit fly) hypothetical protein n=1 Tax=Ceratitis capitata TaxID=7213 RepID=A0A811USK1_CERCA|nr:unnamed protein product [Ceratitis capitata]
MEQTKAAYDKCVNAIGNEDTLATVKVKQATTLPLSLISFVLDASYRTHSNFSVYVEKDSPSTSAPASNIFNSLAVPPYDSLIFTAPLSKWESTLTDKTTVPKWRQMNDFLYQRLKLLESVLDVKCQSSSNGPYRPTRTSTQPSLQPGKSKFALVTSLLQPTCVSCRVFICSNRLPASPLGKWESTLTDKTTVPKWRQMNDFLYQRLKLLESVLDVKCQSSSNGPYRPTKTSTQPSLQPGKSKFALVTSVSQPTCVSCRVFICSNRLPAAPLGKWESTLTDKTTVPKWLQMNDFLYQRLKLLESVLDVKCQSSSNGPYRRRRVFNQAILNLL